MNPMQLTVNVLGRTLIHIELAAPTKPPPAPTPNSQGKPPSEAPGPITERVSNPITHIGFQPRRKWADGRDCW